MKILDSQKNVVASSSLRLNEEKQLVTDVALGEGPSFEVFPVGVSFQGVKEGLEVTVDIPNSGLEPFHVVLEYADVKAMKALPGKGLVPFVLKAFR